MTPFNRQFICYLHWLGFDCWSLGIHVHLLSPNIELHLPFCFIRIGWQGMYRWSDKSLTIGKQYKP